jgi:hypothetical protein
VRGETPTELTTHVAWWYPGLAEQVDVLGRPFYIARYSKVDVTPGQARPAKSTYQRLLEMLKVEAQHSKAIPCRDPCKSLVAAVKTEIKNKRLSHLHIITLK